MYFKTTKQTNVNHFEVINNFIELLMCIIIVQELQCRWKTKANLLLKSIGNKLLEITNVWLFFMLLFK